MLGRGLCSRKDSQSGPAEIRNWFPKQKPEEISPSTADCTLPSECKSRIHRGSCAASWYLSDPPASALHHPLLIPKLFCLSRFNTCLLPLLAFLHLLFHTFSSRQSFWTLQRLRAQTLESYYLGSDPSFALSSCVIMGKLLNLSVLHFTISKVKNKENAYLKGLLKEKRTYVHVKCWDPSPYGQHSQYVRYGRSLIKYSDYLLYKAILRPWKKNSRPSNSWVVPHQVGETETYKQLKK